MQAEDFAFSESLTLTVGFLGSLDEMLIIAVFLPIDVGVKATVTVHEFPFGIVVQLFVWLKSEALASEMSIKLITRSDLPLFQIVTVFSDVLPSPTFPKLTDVGLTDILGGLGVFGEFWDQSEGG